MEKGCNRIEDAVVSGQEEIGLAIDHLHKQRDALTQAMSQLQAQADSADPPSESEGDEWMLEVAVASEPDPHALLRNDVKMRRKFSAELQEAAKDEDEHEDGE